MPPKVKFSKETMIGTALQLVREGGLASLTARALAEKLGATPRVIFGQFANMSELQAEVIIAAEMVVVGYIRKALEDEKPFRSVGVAYILFASKEPQLFQLLFQNPSKDPIRRFQDFLPMKDHSYQLVLDSIVADYPLTLAEARRFLHQHLFIYSHGMASMVASGIYQFSMEEVIGLLTEVCQSLIKEMVGKK